MPALLSVNNMIIKEKNIERTKQLIRNIRESDKPIIVAAQDDDYNRKILEYGKFDLLLNVENGLRKDSLRQIDSGYNHVLAAISAKNKVSLGVDIDKIKHLDKKGMAIILSRLIQNIKICRKKEVKILAIGYRDKKDALSFMQSLGASSKQAKEAISF